MYIHSGRTPVLVQVRGDGALDYSVQNFLPIKLNTEVTRLLTLLTDEQIKERLKSRRDFSDWVMSVSRGPSRGLAALAKQYLNLNNV